MIITVIIFSQVVSSLPTSFLLHDCSVSILQQGFISTSSYGPCVDVSGSEKVNTDVWSWWKTWTYAIKQNAGMEQCLLLSSGLYLHSASAREGTKLSEFYIQEVLTASHPLGTFNYHQKATFSHWFGFCFKLTADLRWLFCSHDKGLELNEETKTGGNRKFLALTACPRGGGRSGIFCVVRGTDWLFPLLDVHSWDHFVLALGKGWWKSCWSDVFCERLQDYINWD